MGRLDGTVAFVTGAARGQGRSHAVRLAEEGADIFAIDICAPVSSGFAPPARPEDLEETASLVASLGRRVVTRVADVRDRDRLAQVLREGVAELGRLDIVCANAGIVSYAKTHELTPDEWHQTLDINLTGVWNTCRAAIPILLEQGHGGSIIITSSSAGLKPLENMGHYAATKHGVLGLMKTMALELGPSNIRVNTVNPGGVNTAMIHNEGTYQLFAGDLDSVSKKEFEERLAPLTVLPISWVEPADVSNAVLFLASDEARYITGVSLPVDGGQVLK
ncbi:NAD(P)-dependent oxidoreductase [Aeromicrobium endophyticum]|uniref:NAD(P)-dependent oxidoreductase n=2 Tax=Aeromicrobium endophyticum TaxID=2292704 RepID=A0A371PAH7_9ACTN|nr:NAD(P)-dependent oxidoreductase [Aeromicrobium endophyticum]